MWSRKSYDLKRGASTCDFNFSILKSSLRVLRELLEIFYLIFVSQFVCEILCAVCFLLYIQTRAKAILSIKLLEFRILIYIDKIVHESLGSAPGT